MFSLQKTPPAEPEALIEFLISMRLALAATAALLGQKTFALSALAGQLAGATHGFSLFAGTLFRWLLVEVPQLHFTEDAFTLKLLLQSPQGLVDIVVANQNLHALSSLRAQNWPVYAPSKLRKGMYRFGLDGFQGETQRSICRHASSTGAQNPAPDLPSGTPEGR